MSSKADLVAKTRQEFLNRQKQLNRSSRVSRVAMTQPVAQDDSLHVKVSQSVKGINSHQLKDYGIMLTMNDSSRVSFEKNANIVYSAKLKALYVTGPSIEYPADATAGSNLKDLGIDFSKLAKNFDSVGNNNLSGLTDAEKKLESLD